MNISGDAFYYSSPSEGTAYRPENPDIDYNLYYNIDGSVPTGQENSVYSVDPLFSNLYTHWKLKPGSPAIGKGTSLPSTFEGFENSTIEIDFHTFDNKPRSSNWNMGIY